MDLSDLAGPPEGSGRAGVDPFDPQVLVSQLAREVTVPLASAAERVAALTATGRITRRELSALRDEIDSARRIALMAQRVSRLVSNHLPIRHERLDLTAMLREVVRERARALESNGIEVRQLLVPAEVRSDGTLLLALLQSMMDWGLEHASARIDLTLDIARWPAQAQLRCAYAYRPTEDLAAAVEALPTGGADTSLDTLSWLLLKQTAAALGVRLRRHDAHGMTELSLEFAATLAPPLQAPQGDADEDTVPAALDTRSLAGSHVLALVTRGDVRSLVNQALRPLGMLIDFVATLDEVRQFCAGGLPQALVYEAVAVSEAFERLRAELQAEAPRMAFIRIDEHGRAFEVLSVAGRPQACVGRDAILDALPAALAFGLARAA